MDSVRGYAPLVDGTGLLQRMLVSLMIVATVEVNPANAQSTGLAGLSEYEKPLPLAALEFMSSPANPAPSMVRELVHPIPVPRGVTLS